MKSKFLDGLEMLLTAGKKPSKIREGAEAMLHAARERRAAFDSEHEKVKESIERGSRITKHRIHL